MIVIAVMLILFFFYFFFFVRQSVSSFFHCTRAAADWICVVTAYGSGFCRFGFEFGFGSEKKRGRGGEIYATLGCAAVCGGKGLEQNFTWLFWNTRPERGGKRRREEGDGRYFSAWVWSRGLDPRLAW